MGLGLAPSTHHSPPRHVSIANPSPPAPAASDELNWIIDLLEKEDATSQETLLDCSHLGKRRPSAEPSPQGPRAGAGKANCFFSTLPLPELGNPCAKDSLEDTKPTNPFLSTDFTYLPGAMSPGSSDVSGQCFARRKGPLACADPTNQWGTAPLPRVGLGLTPGCLQVPGVVVGNPGESISRCQQLVVQAPSLCLSGPVMSHSPNSQDSGGSDLDLDAAEAKLFPDGELFAARRERGEGGLLPGLSSSRRARPAWGFRDNASASIPTLGSREGAGFPCARGLFLSTERGDGAGSGAELGQPGQR